MGVGHARGVLDLLLAWYEPKEKDTLQRAVAALLNGVVKDAMSKPAITIGTDAPLADAWHLLRQHTINRLPVVKNGVLAGIVTRQNVLGVLDTSASTATGRATASPRAGKVPGASSLPSTLRPITAVAQDLGLTVSDLVPAGAAILKIRSAFSARSPDARSGPGSSSSAP